MRINQYTESDKCENKAGKSASLTLTLSHEGQGNGGRKQIWGSKKAMLLSVVGACLSVTLLSASEAHAETCTASPDCKSLGYTESSCSDGGVKCPFGNYWFCGGKKDVCQSCHVGWILNSDLTCSAEKVSGKTPIGVVIRQTITIVGTVVKCQGVAIALGDLGRLTWGYANSQCRSYSASGVSGWHLPTKDELLAVYSNINAVSSGLTKAGGAQFNSGYYWSSTYWGWDSGYECYIEIPPNGGFEGWARETSDNYTRPVLAFSF